MKLSPFFIFVLIGVAGLLAGCNYSGTPGGLSVAVVGFKPAGTALPETRAVVTLRFVNENLGPIGFSGSSHKLYLNGSYVGKAESSVPLGLPGVNSATQDMPIIIEKPEFMERALREPSPAAYRLESMLFITASDEKLQVKIHAEGRVDLRGTPAVSP